MISVIFYASWSQRRAARLQAQETALRVARLAAVEQERLITGASHLLMTLAELPEVRERKPAECSKLFGDIMKKFPYYTNVAAVTPQGDIFCSGLANQNQRNVADRAYFQEALRERRLGISHVLVGRMSGKPNITIAYPSFDPQGPVHAVVFVGLDLRWLNTLSARAQLPPQSILVALDQQGTIFARYPAPEKWVGKSPVKSLFKTIIERKEGVTEAEGLDGIPRLYGFTTLDRLSSKDGALFVAVGIPHNVAFANSDRTFYHSLLVFLFASILAATGTWIGAHLLIRRRLEKLVATARSLGEAESEEGATSSPAAPPSSVDHFDRIEAEMRVALQKAIGRQADFAAMIAHDLRNPLQTIDGAASLLVESGQIGDKDQTLIGMIRRGCVELANTLNEFLDFSKYRAGNFDLAKETFDINLFLEHIRGKHLARSRLAHIRLELAIEPGMQFVHADRKKLERLFDNLVSNALKFTGENGEIEVGARNKNGGVEMWVSDTGIGIAPEELHILFSKYRRASSARKMPGTGLGLMICKMIAEGHGGRISIQSQLNQGTTIYVWLPYESAELERIAS